MRPLRPPFHALPAVPKHIFFTFFIDQPVPKVRTQLKSLVLWFYRSFRTPENPVPEHRRASVPAQHFMLHAAEQTRCADSLLLQPQFRDFSRKGPSSARGVKTRTPAMQLHATIRARNLIHFRRQFSRPPFHVKFQFPRPPFGEGRLVLKPLGS